MSAGQFADLTRCHREMFSRASRKRNAILGLQFSIGVIALATLPLENSITAYVVTGISAVLAFVWALTYLNYKQTRSKAEKLRRCTLASGGLGHTYSKSEICDLLAATGDRGRSERFDDPDYYLIDSHPGPQRLVEMLSESAFWSANLYAESYKLFRNTLILCSVISMVAIFAIIPFVRMESSMLAMRALASVIVLLVSADVLGATIEYREAASEMRCVQQELRSIEGSGHDAPSVMMVMSNYNFVVESAPLMAPGVYERNQIRLEALWRGQQGTYGA